MNEQIKWITDLFDAHDIPYWIDCGTLLGLMREGDLLRKGRERPDYDIDISMWGRYEPRFRSILPLVRKAGYAVRGYSCDKMIFKYALLPSRIDFSLRSLAWIDVSIYRKHGDYAWCPDYYPVKPDKQGLIRYLPRSIRDTLSSILAGWSIPQVRLMRRWVTVDVCAWPLRLFYNVGTNWIPYFYVDRIERLRDSGILLPQDWQNYLEFRYGDWKTPVEEWRFEEDDRGFQCKTPQEMTKNFSGLAELEEANLHTKRSETTSERSVTRSRS